MYQHACTEWIDPADSKTDQADNGEYSDLNQKCMPFFEHHPKKPDTVKVLTDQPDQNIWCKPCYLLRIIERALKIEQDNKNDQADQCLDKAYFSNSFFMQILLLNDCCLIISCLFQSADYFLMDIPWRQF